MQVVRAKIGITMPESKSQPKSTASTSQSPQPSAKSEYPIPEPRVNPVFWIMGVVFAVILGIVFFVINALSVYP